MSEWTDDRIEQLKTLWLEGATSTTIAQKMHISRSAALGKIRRLGLQRNAMHDEQPETDEQTAPKKAAASEKTAAQTPKAPRPVLERRPVETEAAKPAKKPPSAEPKAAKAEEQAKGSAETKPATEKKKLAAEKSAKPAANETDIVPPWDEPAMPVRPQAAAKHPAQGAKAQSTGPAAARPTHAPLNPLPVIPLPSELTEEALAEARHMPAGSGKGITIWELRDGLCKWPVGGLLEPPELFCGAPTTPGSPWCPIHRTIAFTREPSRENAGKPPKR